MKFFTIVALGIPAIGALLLAACAKSASPDTETIGQSGDPIIGGTADTVHQAVVFIGLASASSPSSVSAGCTGTIIKKDVSTGAGWVLTAAHCMRGEYKPSVVLQGNNYESSGAIQYSVTGYTSHPNYDSDDSYDFGIVHIRGTSNSTPTMAIADTDDGLTAGAAVTTIGYGMTDDPSTGLGRGNRERNVVSQIIKELSPRQIAYAFNGKGSCHGDSGGPSIVVKGGVETIVGVVSHGLTPQDCLGDGADARVSGAIPFLRDELAKIGSTSGTCQSCRDSMYSGESECALTVRNCQNDADCNGLATCLDACESSDRPCMDACQSSHLAGVGLYLKAAACGCRACSTECAGSSLCADEPKCGVSFEKSDCTTCRESECCSELYNASTDKVGYECLASSSAKGCETNPPFEALQTCLTRKCSTQCADDPQAKLDGGTANDGSAPSDSNARSGNAADTAGTTTTVITKEGCAASPGLVSSSWTRSGLIAFGLVFFAARRRTRSRTRIHEELV